jgi:hypothetical protein
MAAVLERFVDRDVLGHVMQVDGALKNALAA